jgi:hypothetical protein
VSAEVQIVTNRLFVMCTHDAPLKSFDGSHSGVSCQLAKLALNGIFENHLTKSTSRPPQQLRIPSEIHQYGLVATNMDPFLLVHQHISPKPPLGECFLMCQSRVIFLLSGSVRYAPHVYSVSTTKSFRHASDESYKMKILMISIVQCFYMFIHFENVSIAYVIQFFPTLPLSLRNYGSKIGHL